MTDEQGFPAGTARPQDLSAEVGYGRRIGRNLAFSLTARYVRSDQGFGEKPMQGVSFDIGAAYRGTLRAVEGARWIVGLRLADIGPNVKASDGERYGLPTRGLARRLASPAFPPEPCARHRPRSGPPVPGRNHRFGRRSRIHLFPARCRARRIPPRIRRTKAPGNYASLGCGFIAGPVRCDAAWRFGGNKFNPLNDTFLFSVGFLL